MTRDRIRFDPFSCDDDYHRWVDPRYRVTKHESPYGYSEFFHWGNRATAHGCQAVYSDRLWQWHHDKMSELCGALGKRFERATATELSALLSALWDKPYTVTALAEGCNISNGYPYYILWFKEL